MKLTRRTSPPPELNEEQEQFVRQFSFSCMVLSLGSLIVGPWRLRPVSWLVFALHLTLAVAIILLSLWLVIPDLLSTPRLGHLPQMPTAGLFDYRILVAGWVLFPLVLAFALYTRLRYGCSWRRKAWEDWQWPSFDALVVDETRRSLLGIVYLAMLLILCGLVLLDSVFLL